MATLPVTPPGFEAEVPPAPALDPAAEADLVRSDLRTQGWSHIRRPHPERTFDAIAARLGTVVRRMDVVVSADRERAQREGRRNNLPRPSIYQSTEMAFHTDPPDADVLAWYCVAQDDADGANLLIDLGSLADDFSPGELDALGRIHVDYSVTDAEGVDGRATLPLLSRVNGRPFLHYMPWGIRRPGDPDLNRLLDRFERYVREQPVRSIRLGPGESLFLDNHRLLHGRGPLSASSRRHLRRVHLRLE